MKALFRAYSEMHFAQAKFASRTIAVCQVTGNCFGALRLGIEVVVREVSCKLDLKMVRFTVE